MDMFLKECFLQKTNHYDALKVLGENENALKIGTSLELDLGDDEGKKCVIAKSGNSIIGSLSEEDSKIILIFLNAGWNMVFECRICKNDPKADENKRYSIAIKIKDHHADEAE